MEESLITFLLFAPRPSPSVLHLLQYTETFYRLLHGKKSKTVLAVRLKLEGGGSGSGRGRVEGGCR